LWLHFERLKDKDQRGFIRVKPANGLAGCAPFGAKQLPVISAIPAQTVPEE